MTRSALSALLLLLWLAPTPAAQEEPLLEEVTITGPAAGLVGREEGASTLARRLSLLTELDLTTQGLEGQTDLQILGSTFSGAGLSLAGMGLNTPQTEHFNSELPLPILLFGPPRVLTGLAMARASSGHLVGTVEMEFRRLEDRFHAFAGAGERDMDREGLFWQQRLPRLGPLEGGISLFASRHRSAGLDYSDNHHHRESLGGHLQGRIGGLQIDAALARQDRDLGARGWYGAPAGLASQEELEDTLGLVSARLDLDDGGWLRAQVVRRTIRDKYTLDRHQPGLYRNRHRSTLLAAALDGQLSLAADLDLTWRLDTEEEELLSRYRGSIAATGLGHHRRSRTGLLALPTWRQGEWAISAGLRARFFSGEEPAWLPQAGLEWSPDRDNRFALSWSETVRQPSYTELSYDSPGSLGDMGLERNRSGALELCWSGRPTAGLDLEAKVFARRERDGVDWLRPTAATTRWLATNLDRVRTRGLHLQGRWRVREELDLLASYTQLHKSTAHQPWASRYTFDYARHAGRLTLAWRPCPWCELTTRQHLRRQRRNPMRRGDGLALHSSLEMGLANPAWEGWRLTVRLDNLFDEDYQFLPGQPAPGRIFTATLSLDW